MKLFFEYIKEKGIKLIGHFLLIVIMIIKYFNTDYSITSNIVFDSLLTISITVSIGVTVNIIIDYKKTSTSVSQNAEIINNYNYKSNRNLVGKDDYNLYTYIKNVMDNLSEYLHNRDMTLPWPKDTFKELLGLDRYLDLKTNRFINIKLNEKLIPLIDIIDDFTVLITINQVLPNDYYCTNLYYRRKHLHPYPDDMRVHDEKEETKLESTSKTMISLYEELVEVYFDVSRPPQSTMPSD